MSSLNNRDQGFRDGLAKYPDIKIVEQMDAGTNGREGYATTVENVMNANPDINMILTNCGDSSHGALSTLEMYPDKFAEVKVIGYDAGPDQVTAMKEGKQIIASVAQYLKVIGRTAVEIAEKIFTGEKYESVVNVEVGLVTQENVATFVPKE